MNTQTITTKTIKEYRNINSFIGKDGRYYSDEESLRQADERWKNSSFTYRCPNCSQHVQVGIYDTHLKNCKRI